MTQPSGEGKEYAAAAGLDPESGEEEVGLYLPAGQTLSGNFVIEELIGEGGMATVYRALQKSLNRRVAIKALHPQFTREREFVERFQAESGALAALSHPHIVSVIDRGEHDGVYYFVMEYVDGPNLDELILEGTLKLTDWRRIVTACKDSMTYVHKRAIVHRDIKPSNILMDQEGRIKLSDFGIAHILAGDDGVAGNSTSRRAVGTAYYMAPEQSSDPAGVDHRADVYSLGVTFYKMFTRQLPVDEYPAPSEINNSVPVAVDTVLFRAMAPDRDDRYSSVETFCDDLMKALKDTSRSVTSIMDYRGARGASSLYSGVDFKRSPGGRAAPRGSDPGTRAPSRTPGTGGTKPLSTGWRKRKVHSGATTVDAPAPVAPRPGKDPVPGPKAGARRAALMLLGGLILLMVAGLVIVLLLSADGPTSPPPRPTVDNDAPITDARSPTLEREARLRDYQEQQALTPTELGDGAAEPTGEQPATASENGSGE